MGELKRLRGQLRTIALQEQQLPPPPSSFNASKQQDYQSQLQVDLIARLGLQGTVSSSRSAGDDDNTVTGLLDMSGLLGESDEEEAGNANVCDADDICICGRRLPH